MNYEDAKNDTPMEFCAKLRVAMESFELKDEKGLALDKDLTVEAWVLMAAYNLNQVIEHLGAVRAKGDLADFEEAGSTDLYSMIYASLVPLCITLQRNFRRSVENSAKLEV